MLELFRNHHPDRSPADHRNCVDLSLALLKHRSGKLSKRLVLTHKDNFVAGIKQGASARDGDSTITDQSNRQDAFWQADLRNTLTYQ